MIPADPPRLDPRQAAALSRPLGGEAVDDLRVGPDGLNNDVAIVTTGSGRWGARLPKSDKAAQAVATEGELLRGLAPRRACRPPCPSPPA